MSDPPAPRPRLDWLHDRDHLRRNLSDVRRAVTGGWLDAAALAELASTLDGLLAAGGLSDRQTRKAESIRASVERAILRAGHAPPGPPARG